MDARGRGSRRRRLRLSDPGNTWSRQILEKTADGEEAWGWGAGSDCQVKGLLLVIKHWELGSEVMSAQHWGI